MPLRTALRTSPGAWLTPAMLGLVWLYVSQSITFAHRDPYALGLTARAMNVLGLVVPVFAAAAAYEGVRLARAGVWGLQFGRHRAVVALWATGPALLGGALALLAAPIVVLAHEGLWLPDALVVGLALALLVGWSLAGFAIGASRAHVAVVPSVLLVSFVSFVLPRVLQPVWLLHPFGTSLELCCRADEVLAPEVVLSILVFSGGLAAAALVAIGRRHMTRAAGVACVAIAAGGLLVAGLIASPVPMSPTTHRSGGADACGQGANVQVCVWPEHAGILPAALDSIDVAVGRWSSLGIPAPRLVTEDSTIDRPDALTLDLAVGSDAADAVDSMARALIPSAPPCASTQPWPAGAAFDYLWGWLALTGGVPRDRIGYRGMETTSGDHPDAPPESLPPIGPLVDRVLSLPTEEQRRWASSNLAAMRECSVLAPLEP